jgi:hypothetical protein
VLACGGCSNCSDQCTGRRTACMFVQSIAGGGVQTCVLESCRVHHRTHLCLASHARVVLLVALAPCTCRAAALAMHCACCTRQGMPWHFRSSMMRPDMAHVVHRQQHSSAPAQARHAALGTAWHAAAAAANTGSRMAWERSGA